MATESDLRDLLRGPDPEGPAIDVDAVLRRARARRRPRVLAASAIGSLALVGVLTPAVLTSLPRTDDTAVLVAEESSASDAAGSAEESALAARPASAWDLDACGIPLAEIVNGLPLALEIAVPGIITAGTTSVDVEVTLRNTGSEPFTGIAGAPAVAFASADSTVLWHSSGLRDSAGLIVDLPPGGSLTFTTTFEAIACDPAPESVAEGPPSGPPAGAGSYLVRAAIDVQPTQSDGATGIPVIVGSPAVPTEVR